MGSTGETLSPRPGATTITESKAIRRTTNRQAESSLLLLLLHHAVVKSTATTKPPTTETWRPRLFLPAAKPTTTMRTMTLKIAKNPLLVVLPQREETHLLHLLRTLLPTDPTRTMATREMRLLPLLRTPLPLDATATTTTITSVARLPFLPHILLPFMMTIIRGMMCFLPLFLLVTRETYLLLLRLLPARVTT